MEGRWRIELFGGLRVAGSRGVERFRTQKTGFLLAYLACRPGQRCSREALCELLWPESDREAARARLRVALSSLRRQLEPPGVPPGTVLLTDRGAAGLNAAVVTTDVGEFERGLRQAERLSGTGLRAEALAGALAHYRGELLPGCRETWAVAERARLAEQFVRAALRLAGMLAAAGDLEQALDHARRAAAAEPACEEARALVNRLLATAGRSGRMEEWKNRTEVFHSSTLPLFHSSAPVPPAATLTLLVAAGDPPLNEDERAALRPAFEQSGGREVRMAGGVAAVFPQVAAALERAAAIARQPLLRPLRVAVVTADVGPEEQRDLGRALARARRLVAAAPAGQVLCSEATAILARRSPGSGQQLIDLGLYPLAGAERPERLFQLHCLEPAKPPLLLPASRASSVPPQFTRFFGRDTEIAALATMLAPRANRRMEEWKSGSGGDGKRGRDDSGACVPPFFHSSTLPLFHAPARLVTLTGPGGSGKTRLAVEVAGRLEAAYRGALWFVPLAETREVTRLGAALAGALRLPLAAGASPLDQAAAALARRAPTLLVLDNFEQLVDDGAETVSELLARCPGLRILATSRRPLGLQEEQTVGVGPLPVPVDSCGQSGPRTINHQSPRGHPTINSFPSVQLFVDRARATRPGFALTERNAAAVAELCARLEGIPLAIELAAARAAVLTPAQMLAHLERRFELLATQRRGVPERHRTLRAALDASFQLLSPDLQRHFARLSVFRGGWSPDVAEAVAGKEVGEWENGGMGEWGPSVRISHSPTLPFPHSPAPPLSHSPMPPLAALHRLRDASLILAEEAKGGMRFRMLETIREYAAEQLTAAERVETAGRHAAWFLALAERAAGHFLGPAEGEWLDRLAVEGDNLRAALEHTIADCGLRIADCETRSGQSAIRNPQSAIPLRLAAALARFWEVRGGLAEGRERLAAALAGAPERTAVRSRALYGAGRLAFLQCDYAAARTLLTESLAIGRELEDARAVALALHGLGMVANNQGDDVAVRELNREALALNRAAGDRRGQAANLEELATVAFHQANLDAARALHEEALSSHRELGDRLAEARSLHYLGLVAFSLGEEEAARGLHEESLAIRRQLRDALGIAASLDSIARLERRRGNLEAARACCRESLAIFRERGNRRDAAGALNGLAEIERLQRRYAEARALVAEALAISRDLGARRVEARCLHTLAEIAASAGDAASARARHDESLAVRRAIGDRPGIAESLAAIAGLAA